MTQHAGIRLTFEIDKVSHLKHGDVSLVLDRTYLYSAHKTLGVEYKVMLGDTEAGVLNALINDDAAINPEEGNIGLTLHREHLNKGIPTKAARALCGLFKHFGQNEYIITFDKEDGSIHQTCLELSGKYLDTLPATTGKSKIRYVMSCEY